MSLCGDSRCPAWYTSSGKAGFEEVGPLMHRIRFISDGFLVGNSVISSHRDDSYRLQFQYWSWNLAEGPRLRVSSMNSRHLHPIYELASSVSSTHCSVPIFPSHLIVSHPESVPVSLPNYGFLDFYARLGDSVILFSQLLLQVLDLLYSSCGTFGCYGLISAHFPVKVPSLVESDLRLV